MNILIVIPELTIGGAQVTAVNLANNLSRLPGNNIYIFRCYEMLDEKLYHSLDKNVKDISFFEMNPLQKSLNGLANLFFKKTKLKNKVYHALQAKHFNAAIEKYDIQIVNSHLADADFFTYMTVTEKNFRKVKWAITMHGSYENGAERHPLCNLVFQKVNGIIYLTDKNLNVLKNITPAPSHLKTEKIYNCLGERQLAQASSNVTFPRKNDLFTFGIVSRAMFEKGWQEAIDAVIKLNESGRSCRLVLGGEGNAKAALQKKYSHIPYIEFLGQVNNPFEVIKSFDVGLLPSYTESLPYTIMEYLCAGIPSVGTNVGEIKQMLIGNDGMAAGTVISLNTDGKPDSAQLYDAMKSYTENTALYELHKANTKKMYAQFDPAQWGKKYIAFFNKL